MLIFGANLSYVSGGEKNVYFACHFDNFFGYTCPKITIFSFDILVLQSRISFAFDDFEEHNILFLNPGRQLWNASKFRKCIVITIRWSITTVYETFKYREQNFWRRKNKVIAVSSLKKAVKECSVNTLKLPYARFQCFRNHMNFLWIWGKEGGSHKWNSACFRRMEIQGGQLR